MKQIPILVLMLFAIVKSYSQNYLISFAGEGASTTIDSVVVENLTKNTSATIPGGDQLKLEVVLSAINSLNNDDNTLHIYPNPAEKYSIIEFYAVKGGWTAIEVFDLSGKLLAQTRSSLECGKHSYTISGLSSGVYTVVVKTRDNNYTKKLICQSDNKRDIKISYNGVSGEINSPVLNKLKSTNDEISMQYTEGDILKLTGISGIYSTIYMDIPTSSKTIIFTFVSCTDADTNHYPVVTIGEQTWMAMNLKTIRYNNLDTIETTTPDTLDIYGESTPNYQWTYKGYENKVPTYGRLYTWYAVTDDRNVCPIGWHVPANDEWTILTTYLGGEDVAGGKLKETGTTNWFSPNTDATNETGFTALPGGTRNATGPFEYIGDSGTWWSSTENETVTGDAWLLHLMFDWSGVSNPSFSESNGLSVRCVMD